MPPQQRSNFHSNKALSNIAFTFADCHLQSPPYFPQSHQHQSYHPRDNPSSFRFPSTGNSPLRTYAIEEKDEDDRAILLRSNSDYSRGANFLPNDRLYNREFAVHRPSALQPGHYSHHLPGTSYTSTSTDVIDGREFPSISYPVRHPHRHANRNNATASHFFGVDHPVDAFNRHADALLPPRPFSASAAPPSYYASSEHGRLAHPPRPASASYYESSQNSASRNLSRPHGRPPTVRGSDAFEVRVN